MVIVAKVSARDAKMNLNPGAMQARIQRLQNELVEIKESLKIGAPSIHTNLQAHFLWVPQMSLCKGCLEGLSQAPQKMLQLVTVPRSLQYCLKSFIRLA